MEGGEADSSGLGAAGSPFRQTTTVVDLHCCRGERGGSAGGDHQGAGHTHPRGDPCHEPQLHRVQVPSDQGSCMEQSFQQAPSC